MEQYLYLSGGATVAFTLSLAAYSWLRRGAGPLWLQLAVASAVGIAVALTSVLFTARAMLITESDLPRLVPLLLFAGAVSLSLGVALAALIGRRVRALAEGARALAAGDLAARVPTTGSDELAALAAEFNQMADQLAAAAGERERQEAARRELFAAVSHDLRTPLTSLRALTDALGDGLADDPATVQRYYATMRGQIDHLNSLIDDLFELAQLDAGATRLDLAAVSPADLLSDAINGLRPQAEAQGVRLAGDAAHEGPAALIAPNKIERVLYNLVANAIRHTPAGGEVLLSVGLTDLRNGQWATRNGHQIGHLLSADAVRGAGEIIPHPSSFILFSVRDTGEGIAPEDLPHVFERFYRAERSRSRATGGAGLGLAIARSIVEAHGGRIWIDSARGVGTTVSFTVPAAG
jgi:signal transduction histidine kinase